MSETGNNAKPDRIEITPAAGTSGIGAILSGYGFLVDVTCGMSVKDALETGMGLDADYIETHINTILHNGRPVDNIDTHRIYQPSTLALSAALPGLFGAAFRKQGEYAALRPLPGYIEPPSKPENETITLTIKLFNITAKELGPRLLRQGVRMDADDFLAFWKTRTGFQTDNSFSITLNGKAIPSESLRDSIRSGTVTLVVHNPASSRDT